MNSIRSLRALLAAGCLLAPLSAPAGHHGDTALAREHPQFDTQDIFAFPAPEGKKTVFALTFNPKGKAGDAATFGAKGLYNIHIGADANLSKGLTFTVTYKGTHVHVYESSSAFPEMSKKGTLIGETEIGKPQTLKNGMRVWTATVQDPFPGNGAGIGLLKKAAAEGKFDADAFATPGNLFAKGVSGGIVLEVPNSLLPEKIHYCASTAAEIEPGHWHRINRIGHVLLPHLYLADEQQKEIQDSSDISTDLERKSKVVAVIEKYTALAGAQKDPKAYAEAWAARILPDSVPYTVGTPAAYKLPDLNGRALSDNAMDTAVEILVGKPFPANSGEPDKFTKEFPSSLRPNNGLRAAPAWLDLQICKNPIGRGGRFPGWLYMGSILCRGASKENSHESQAL
ncbi:MAG: hypothetical protein V4726_00775 [Verrucomicrobiota bacterium]